MLPAGAVYGCPYLICLRRPSASARSASARVSMAGRSAPAPPRADGSPPSPFRARLRGGDLRAGRRRVPGVAPGAARASVPVLRGALPAAPPGAPHVPPRVSGRRCPARGPARHHPGRRGPGRPVRGPCRRPDHAPGRHHGRHRGRRAPGPLRPRASLFSRPWSLLPVVFLSRHLTLPAEAEPQSSARGQVGGRWGAGAVFVRRVSGERTDRGRDGRGDRCRRRFEHSGAGAAAEAGHEQDRRADAPVR